MSEADRLFPDGEAYERLIGRKSSRVPIDLRQPSDCRELLDQEIYSLVQDIDRNGYAVLTEYISRADIDVLRHFVRDAVAAAGNSYGAVRLP